MLIATAQSVGEPLASFLAYVEETTGLGNVAQGLIGCAFLFYGLRVIKVTWVLDMAVSTGTFAAILGSIFLMFHDSVQSHPSLEAFVSRWLVYYIFCFVCGAVVGALIAWPMFHFMVAMVGVMFSVAITVPTAILAASQLGLVGVILGGLLVIGGAVLGGVLFYKFYFFLLQGASCFVGAAMILLAYADQYPSLPLWSLATAGVLLGAGGLMFQRWETRDIPLDFGTRRQTRARADRARRRQARRRRTPATRNKPDPQPVREDTHD